MSYSQVCFIQYRSSPVPLCLNEISSSSGELMRSGEVNQLT